MKVFNLFVSALFLLLAVSGCATSNYSGGADGRSSHQTPESSVNQRRLVELRQSLIPTGKHPGQSAFVIINNNTNHSLELSLSGTTRYTIHIGANSVKSQRVMPGGYTFEAQIPGFPPYAGQVMFAESTNYSWDFVYSGQ